MHTDTEWSYHDYRNSNIKNYFFAAENLARRGYYVLRMGSSNKEIIDKGISKEQNWDSYHEQKRNSKIIALDEVRHHAF